MAFGRYMLRRALMIPIQLLAIVTITFFIVRFLPGDPARVMAGPLATQETIQAIRESLHLDEPALTQYMTYLKDLVRGDLGDSWYTAHPVSFDMAQRFPATFELITLALILILLVTFLVGFVLATARKGSHLRNAVEKVTFVYGMLAGSLPDFWIGLLLIYLLYFKLGIVPAPIGRLDILLAPPRQVTGLLIVDSLLAGDLAVLSSALSHMALPVLTLAFVYGGPILKMLRSTMQEIMQSQFILQARASGLRDRTIVGYAMRNALPPVINLTASNYSFLLSGAVLVETVFSWPGIGSYAVQAIGNSDYMPIQGVVLIAGSFTLLIYILIDFIHYAIDPRIRQ